MIPKCMRCGSLGVLVTGEKVYPHRPDLASKRFFRCPKCLGIRVGCHGNSKRPLGPVMVDQETRDSRVSAHRQFDQLWRRGIVSRSHAYDMLSVFLKCHKSKAHIGHLTLDQARAVADWAKGHLRMFDKCGGIDES